MSFTIKGELEDDGRWLAEVPQLPGVLAYGSLHEPLTFEGKASCSCPDPHRVARQVQDRLSLRVSSERIFRLRVRLP